MGILIGFLVVIRTIVLFMLIVENKQNGGEWVVRKLMSPFSFCLSVLSSSPSSPSSPLASSASLSPSASASASASALPSVPSSYAPVETAADKA